MLNCPVSVNNPFTGAGYFFKGAALIWRKELRLFMLIPLIINILIFVGLTGLFIGYFETLSEWLKSHLSDWLVPLYWVAWVVVGIVFLLVYAYSFNLITNLVAAPFYGLLSERTEYIATGEKPPEEAISSMVPRVLGREITKLIYFLLRGILIMLIMILISSIPVIGFLGPLIGLGWGAWSMSIQYVDYPADNNQHRFQDLRDFLWDRKYSSLGFGTSVMFFTLVPIVNIFVMPSAVVGGTLFWCHELKRCKARQGQ